MFSIFTWVIILWLFLWLKFASSWRKRVHYEEEWKSSYYSLVWCFNDQLIFLLNVWLHFGMESSVPREYPRIKLYTDVHIMTAALFPYSGPCSLSCLQINLLKSGWSTFVVFTDTTARLKNVCPCTQPQYHGLAWCVGRLREEHAMVRRDHIRPQNKGAGWTSELAHDWRTGDTEQTAGVG